MPRFRWPDEPLVLLLLLSTCVLAKPNVVVILADDLGWGDVSSYHDDSRIRTPNLDRIAASGMRFTDGHSNSAVCTPTRYGLLTGRYCWRGRLKRGVLNGYSPPLIEEGRPTLPSVLRDGGYQTGCIGKWHLGMEIAKRDGDWDYDARIRRGPTSVGFDSFLGISASLDMPPYALIQDDHFLQKPDLQFEAVRKQLDYIRAGAIAAEFKHVDYLPLVADQAEAFIAAKAGDKKPFFLYLPLPSPHKPVIPNKQFAGSSGIGQYGDYVVETDWVIGRVVEALEASGVLDETMIVVTSDNGSFAVPEEYEVIQKGHRVNAHFRGQKTDVYEGGHRVPFLVSWPEVVGKGLVSGQVICTTDIMATVLSAAGIKMPEGAGEDSHDFMPVLKGRHDGGPLREATVHHSASGLFALRKGKWKLIFGRGSGGRTKVPKSDPELQLYDMEKDPGESRNLAAEHPDIVEEMTALLGRSKKAGHRVGK